MKSICLATIGFLGVVLCPFFIQAESPANETQVRIQGLSTATKGFPYILKITVDGPGSIPIASLYDSFLPIRISFTAVNTNQSYTLPPSRGPLIDYVTQEGERTSSDKQGIRMASVERGKQQSVLVDLASIMPDFGPGQILDDVMPGEYNVNVTFPGDVTQSNPLRLCVVAPDAAERQFLGEVMQQGRFRLGEGVNWTKVLRSRIRVPSNNWDRLTPATKEQTAFHRLLIDLLPPDKTLGADDENRVKTTSLPKYLEPERDCLLYEITVAAGRGDEGEALRLMKLYPDLEWRVQDIKQGKTYFLRCRKPMPTKANNISGQVR